VTDECKTCRAWRDAKNVILVVACIVSFAVIGCGSLLDRVTPADLPIAASDYLGLEPRDLTSLHELKNAEHAIIVQHRDIQTDILRMAEDDAVMYQDAISFTQQAVVESQKLQDIVVGASDQPFSILGILAGLTGGAAIGRALKRPGDYSPAEVQETVAKAKASVLNGANTNTGPVT
jgi:hypothetical protein